MGTYLHGLLESKEITVDYEQGRVFIGGRAVGPASPSLISKLHRLVVYLVTWVNLFMLILGPAWAIWRLPHRRRVEGRLYSKIYVVPVFYNLILDYVLEGDYARYITRVEIKRNHVPRGWRGYRLREGWRATFYFSQEPREGVLDIKYI